MRTRNVVQLVKRLEKLLSYYNHVAGKEFLAQYMNWKKSPMGEINRCVVFATTHVTKTVNDPASTSASDVKIRKNGKLKNLLMLIEKIRMISTTMLLLRHVDVIKKVMYEEWEEVLPRPRCVLRY